MLYTKGKQTAESTSRGYGRCSEETSEHDRKLKAYLKTQTNTPSLSPFLFWCKRKLKGFARHLWSNKRYHTGNDAFDTHKGRQAKQGQIPIRIHLGRPVPQLYYQN